MRSSDSILPGQVLIKYESNWRASGVEQRYLEWVRQELNDLAGMVCHYDPEWDIYDRDQFKESVEGRAYIVTELLAQFCAAGMRWRLTDKARFLSPTVDVGVMVRRLVRQKFSEVPVPLAFFDWVDVGAWDFLQVAERTQTWFEALSFSKEEVGYLLWAAYRVLDLLGVEERIPGFTPIALRDDQVLDGFCRCESPIESVLYMQLVVDGLRPPDLQVQWVVGRYRLDMAVPRRRLNIECDGVRYHDKAKDEERDRYLRSKGWLVLRFPGEKILRYPGMCSEKVLQELEPDLGCA